MEKDLVASFDEKRNEIKSFLAEKHYHSYEGLLQGALKIMFPDSGYDEPDPDKIHCIDDGHYQGTLVFLVPEKCYQPNTYWVFKVSYGSCSGCDTLQAIHNYGDDPPTEKEVEEYFTLILHMIQSAKKI